MQVSVLPTLNLIISSHQGVKLGDGFHVLLDSSTLDAFEHAFPSDHERTLHVFHPNAGRAAIPSSVCTHRFAVNRFRRRKPRGGGNVNSRSDGHVATVAYCVSGFWTGPFLVNFSTGRLLSAPVSPPISNCLHGKIWRLIILPYICYLPWVQHTASDCCCKCCCFPPPEVRSTSTG